MINVVFLLLIFFLMTAQIAPPDPVDIAPPTVTEAEPTVLEDAQTVWLDRDGVLHLAEAQGDAALTVLQSLAGPITLRADADLPAAEFARVLRRLSEAGISEIVLVAIAGVE